jgi:hypothetical protein
MPAAVVQALVDRLVTDMPPRLLRDGPPQPGRDPFGAPLQLQTLLDQRLQLEVAGEDRLAATPTLLPSPRVSQPGVVPTAVPGPKVAAQLA